MRELDVAGGERLALLVGAGGDADPGIDAAPREKPLGLGDEEREVLGPREDLGADPQLDFGRNSLV